MGHTLYPTSANVQRELTSRGMVEITPTAVQALLDYDAAAADGRRKVEGETGRRFLGVTQTRTFDYPCGSRTLPLRQDLCALTSLVVGGTAKVLNTDFYLKPDDADLDELPWDRVEFNWPYSVALINPRRAITIAGTWGYSALIPDDAWNAMLDAACMYLTPSLQTAITNGLVSWKMDNLEERYSDNPFAGAIKGWGDRLDKAISRYRRVTVGI